MSKGYAVYWSGNQEKCYRYINVKAGTVEQAQAQIENDEDCKLEYIETVRGRTFYDFQEEHSTMVEEKNGKSQFYKFEVVNQF